MPRMGLDPERTKQRLCAWLASGRPAGPAPERSDAADFPPGCAIRRFSGAPLFHATAEPFDPAGLRPGADGLLWAAEDSATAQTYIPAHGLWMSFLREEWRRNDTFRPRRDLEPIWRAMGLELGDQTRFDRLGQAECFHWANRKGSFPTMGEVYDFLDAGGYRDGECAYRLPLSRAPSGEGWVMERADHRTPGRLFVLWPGRPLDLLDITRSEGGDLLDLDYHKLGIFGRARDAGLDGALIRDYCQSDNWGNVGHRSVGLFDAGLAACRWDHVPATNFDWPEGRRPEMGESPEFASLAARLGPGFPGGRGGPGAGGGVAAAREGR